MKSSRNDDKGPVQGFLLRLAHWTPVSCSSAAGERIYMLQDHQTCQQNSWPLWSASEGSVRRSTSFITKQKCRGPRSNPQSPVLLHVGLPEKMLPLSSDQIWWFIIMFTINMVLHIVIWGIWGPWFWAEPCPTCISPQLARSASVLFIFLWQPHQLRNFKAAPSLGTADVTAMAAKQDHLPALAGYVPGIRGKKGACPCLVEKHCTMHWKQLFYSQPSSCWAWKK